MRDRSPFRLSDDKSDDKHVNTVFFDVFFDVDTQLDFLCPAGALPVPGAEDIARELTELTNYAAANGIRIISTADAHSEDDPEFKTWKPHCVASTAGQQKANHTLLAERAVLSAAPHALDQIRSQISRSKQIVVEKQMLDCFTNPNLRPLLNSLNAERYVVYGLVTELCVRCALFGLLDTGARVELVTDAIKSLSESDARQVIERFKSQGGRLTTVAAVTG